MKVQVRKNVLTHLWEVQGKDAATARWCKLAEFDTKEKADKYALSCANSKGNKTIATAKKTQQKTKKAAKNGKNAKQPKEAK